MEDTREKSEFEKFVETYEQGKKLTDNDLDRTDRRGRLVLAYRSERSNNEHKETSKTMELKYTILAYLAITEETRKAALELSKRKQEATDLLGDAHSLAFPDGERKDGSPKRNLVMMIDGEIKLVSVDFYNSNISIESVDVSLSSENVDQS